MCKTKKEIKYHKNIKDFLKYFYKKTIIGNFSDILSDEELLEIYNTNCDFKAWIDKEFIIANEQLSARQRNKSITLWTDPCLEESRLKVLVGLQLARDNGAGQKGGMANVESGWIKSLGEKWGGINWKMMAEDIFTCSVCGYTGSGRSNHRRWHGENCQLPLMEKMFALLPNHFTKNMAKEILKKNNLKVNLIDKLLYRDLTYSKWTFRSYDGIKDHSYDVPVYSKTFDIDELKKTTVDEIVKNNIKVGNERVIAHNNKNKKLCEFCNTTQSSGNYIKNGHNTGKCIIPKVMKKSEHQLKKEKDINTVIDFFKDYGWFNTLNLGNFIKKLELINTPKGLNNLLERTDGFKMEISIQPSPAGPRKTKMWIYEK